MNGRLIRIPALLVLTVWMVRLATSDPPHCFLDLVNLVFHEAGHPIFGLFGGALGLVGGTLGQLLVPAALLVHFLLRREKFGAALCAWWLGENFVNIAVYMADARTLRLPLVGGGEHDWNNIFYALGLLGEDPVARTAALTNGLGVVVMIAAFLWALVFVLPGGAVGAIDRLLSGTAPALRSLLPSGTSD